MYVGRDCHLCERAREDLEPLRRELAFSLQEVDITGDPELERRYREWLPVLEVGGEWVSAYRVEPDALRRALGAP